MASRWRRGGLRMYSNCINVNFAAKCIPLLIQQNINGSDFFNRSWAEYKAGFSDNRGNYWLGNDLLSQLTLTGRYKLRFDLQALNGSWYYAEYSTFVVLSEAYNYRLQVSGYSGNADDGFRQHNGMEFTTYDRDNDPWTSSRYNNNCAVLLGGGCWFAGCGTCDFNNARGRTQNFRWWLRLYLQTSRMWLTC